MDAVPKNRIHMGKLEPVLETIWERAFRCRCNARALAGKHRAARGPSIASSGMGKAHNGIPSNGARLVHCGSASPLLDVSVSCTIQISSRAKGSTLSASVFQELALEESTVQQHGFLHQSSPKAAMAGTAKELVEAESGHAR